MCLSLQTFLLCFPTRTHALHLIIIHIIKIDCLLVQSQWQVKKVFVFILFAFYLQRPCQDAAGNGFIYLHILLGPSGNYALAAIFMKNTFIALQFCSRISNLIKFYDTSLSNCRFRGQHCSSYIGSVCTGNLA